MKFRYVIEKQKCTGCMACKTICPKNAIAIVKDKEGFQYPKINIEKCIECGACIKNCPVNAKLERNIEKTKVYSCKNKDERERMNSSSGGVFSLIAKYILQQNGIVFGAKFDENFNVVHDYIKNEKRLDEFRGSKYVQSQIKNSFKKVKEFLLQNKKVLFTGTPCQVEGLLSYLGKDYDNLYTQDIICHGVPSPKVWKKYLKYKMEKRGEKVIDINFRRKDILGWNNYQISYHYSGEEENIHHNDDVYMKMFLRNFCLRESCYSCEFKKIKRNSDITLGDFWGIEQINPQVNDEKGVSALLVHSKKGAELFQNIEDKIDYTEEKIDDIIKFNPCYCVSTNYNENRKEFFKDIDKMNFEDLIEKYITE